MAEAVVGRRSAAAWLLQAVLLACVASACGDESEPSKATIFTQNVLTVEKPVQLSTCQPSQAGSTDYFSAPILSKDGLHCCYEKIILKAMR